MLFQNLHLPCSRFARDRASFLFFSHASYARFSPRFANSQRRDELTKKSRVDADLVLTTLPRLCVSKSSSIHHYTVLFFAIVLRENKKEKKREGDRPLAC